MRDDSADSVLWSRLSGLVAETIGLHYPPPRWGDLQRGVAGAARDFGFENATACADWLCSEPPTPAHLQILAGHLTTGETYFQRDQKTFQALREHVLPGLICSRRDRERRLNFWSAGCCTGEEPYSLAILLHELIPDRSGWQIKIIGTDINPRFLQAAATGVYGEWSFRGTPPDYRRRFFQPVGDGRFALRPEIKQLVNFAPHNLVDDAGLAEVVGTGKMDLIFCRNVLMYFAPEQTHRVVGHLRRALADDGWLSVGPCEMTPTRLAQFETEILSEVPLFRKRAVASGDGNSLPRCAPNKTRGEPGGPAESASPAPAVVPARPPQHAAFFERAQVLADRGQLADALTWCDQSIADDKLDFRGYYLRAMILLEQGDAPEARRLLQGAVYLQPEFILAHFALGNLACRSGWVDEAGRHFDHAFRLLARLRPDEIVPESDGLTAGGLAEMISALAACGAPS